MKNLKILGLALVAVFAMSAIVASVASAHAFRAESSPTTLTGKQEGSDVFTTDGGTVTCTTATYTGSVTGTSASSASATPTYSGCTAFGFLSVPIHTNGCEYEFQAEPGIKINCPTKAEEIEAPGCTVTVNSQTPGGTIEYTNVGTGTTQELTIDVSLTGIHYTEDNNGGGCVKAGVEKTNGTYKGHAIVTGENASSVHHGVWWE